MSDNCWKRSEKQRGAFDKIMSETDFVKLEEKAAQSETRFHEILECIQILDHVKMGLYPGVKVYQSIREQFASKRVLTDKQINFLHKMVKRFRKQLDKI